MTSTCRRGDPPPTLRTSAPCHIRAEVKRRDGHPLWWCDVHGEAASGPGGVRLDRCPGADAHPACEAEVLDLDPNGYPGGIGIWPALPPAVAVGGPPITLDVGVHVHARMEPGGRKVIDDTFKIVYLESDGRVVKIDAEDALAHLAARLAGHDVSSMQCPRCHFEHLDRDIFAVRPHRRHQCQRCGRFFWANSLSIGNGVAVLDNIFGPRQAPVPAPGTLDLRSEDFESIEIWGSSEAIVWTAPKSEMGGLHVHATNAQGHLEVDETFGRVSLDGVDLDLDLCAS